MYLLKKEFELSIPDLVRVLEINKNYKFIIRSLKKLIYLVPLFFQNIMIIYLLKYCDNCKK